MTVLILLAAVVLLPLIALAAAAVLFVLFTAGCFVALAGCVRIAVALIFTPHRPTKIT